mgnify:CR=1 FL=1
MPSSKTNQQETAFIFISPLNRQKGVMQLGQWRCSLSLGRSGTRYAKREGDGATPVTDLRPLRLFLRPDKTGFRPLSPHSFHFIRKNQGWCDAITHSAYNRLVQLPFSQSHEEMWRQDALYDAVLETNWNTCPRVIGHGSAIFIHLQRSDCGPTAGCLAFNPRDLRLLLQKLPKIRAFRIQPANRKPKKKQ